MAIVDQASPPGQADELALKNERIKELELRVAELERMASADEKTPASTDQLKDSER